MRDFVQSFDVEFQFGEAFYFAIFYSVQEVFYSSLVFVGEVVEGVSQGYLFLLLLEGFVGEKSRFYCSFGCVLQENVYFVINKDYFQFLGQVQDLLAHLFQNSSFFFGLFWLVFIAFFAFFGVQDLQVGGFPSLEKDGWERWGNVTGEEGIGKDIQGVQQVFLVLIVQVLGKILISLQKIDIFYF